ncbi:hypothetical protein P7D22_14400, partial [Lichenihabitans sp. Uapishka_5]|uniref:beta strand repeat-containing protein n=1 Tax=Lichenihabitans sp. Uapishka_5 TaxID=3037302 RepID=UPI0029E7DD5A
GTHADASGTLAVTVAPVADVPTLTLAAAAGLENQPIALAIGSSLVNPAAGETLAVTIAGVPTGASLSAGIHQADGSWTLTQAQLTGLTLTPAAGYSGTLSLSVTAEAAVGGTHADASSTLAVTVAPVADVPTLTLAAAAGLENQPIALAIGSGLVNPAAGETLAVTVAGVPTGASLSAGIHNTDGSWTLTQAQLTGLTLTPAAGYSGTLSLSVTAEAAVGGTHADASGTLAVTVAPVAVAPSLLVVATAGVENSSIPVVVFATPYVNQLVTVTITGVPTGAVLSAGTHNGDGSWTLQAADLAGLSLTPPHNFSGSIALTVTATDRVSDGTTASSSVPLTLTVAPVATAPTLQLGGALGSENAAVALSIAASNPNGDAVSVTIAGVPTGATLSAGTHNADGTWTLAPAQLAALTLMPPASFTGALSLQVTATTPEANGSLAATTAVLPVSITAVAAAPTLQVAAATGLEDRAVPLSIHAAVLSPNETISVTFAGIPAGATLSAGTHNPDGTWTLTAAELTGLTLLPPANYSGAFTLNVTATALEPNGSQAQTAASLGVSIAPVADAPSLAVLPATGLENKPIALGITSALVAPAVGETLSVTISGMPTGATLSAGVQHADGSWTLTAAQLTGLTLTPPPGFSGQLTLGVDAQSAVGGTHADTVASCVVSVVSVAATPLLSGSAVTGQEDTAIALNLAASLPAGTVNETLAVSIGGVPPGASLSAGTYMGNNTWSLAASQLAGLTLTPAANMSGTIALTVTATAFDPGGASASTSLPVLVTATGVADAPLLQVTALSGLEDTPLRLNIGLALSDTDGSEHLGSVTIGGVPGGATLSAGLHNPDGSWTLTPAQLTGLTVLPPANSNAGFTLTVAATSIESNGSTATATATIPVTLVGVADTPLISVANVIGASGASIPLTIAGSLTDTDGSETISFVLHGVPVGFALNHGSNNGDNTWTLSAADLSALTLTTPAEFNGTVKLYATSVSHEQGGSTATSAVASFTVGVGTASASTVDLGLDVNVGVAGAVGAGVGVNLQLASGGFSSGAIFVQENSAYTIADASTLSGSPLLKNVLYALSGFVFAGLPSGATLSAGVKQSDGTWFLTTAQLTNLKLTPPQNSDTDFTITTTAKLVGLAPIAMGTTAVHILDPAATPTLSAVAATVNEGSAVPLTIAGALTNTAGSETLSYSISHLPTGATLSAGTNNGNGSWTVTAAQLVGLSINMPAYFSGTTSIKVEAVATELKGDAAATGLSVPVTVTPVAQGVTLTAAAVSGVGTAPIPLNLSAALKDTSGAEAVTKVVIGNLPAGAVLTGATSNGDGTWTATAGTLGTVALVPAAHASGDYTLSVTVITKEVANASTNTASASLAVHVGATLEAPALSLKAAAGLGGGAIPLTIASHLLDAAAPQILVVRLDGVPAGATLSAGIHDADGSWVLTGAQLAGLTITPPAGQTTDFSVSVTAIAHDRTTGLDATATGVLAVTIVEPPSLTVLPAIGTVNGPVALHLAAALAEVSATQSLSLTIGGVPTGATLSAGSHNLDGTWTVTGAQLNGLTLTPASGAAAQTFTLGITAHAHDSVSGLDATASATLPVTLEATMAAPTLTVEAAYGLADTPLPLHIGAAVTDLIPGDTLFVTVSGVPTGATLSAGTHNLDGSWTLTGAQLATLTLTPAPHATGDATLTVVATTHDPVGGHDTSVSASLPVSFLAALDAPTVHEASPTVVGFENTVVHLGLDVSVPHLLPTESLTVTLDGLPAGATLSAGTHHADGSWTLDAAQWAGADLTLGPHDAGSTTLHVSAVAHDSVTGLSATTSATLALTVLEPVAAPHLSVAPAVAHDGVAIPLAIAASLADGNATESLTLDISGLPDGAALSAGTHHADGSWTLAASDLAHLTLSQPTIAQDFTLTVSATAHETLTGTESHTVATLPVSFADHPTITGVTTTSAAYLAAISQLATTIGATAPTAPALHDVAPFSAADGHVSVVTDLHHTIF